MPSKKTNIMNQNTIITVGRQFGSGGREIGKMLAETFGYTYYDKELISVAAQESGLCEDVFEKADERASSSLAYVFPLGFSYMGMFSPYHDILSNDGLFKLQSDAIRKLAEKESCVLVGRCADYILRDHPDCISLFIHSDMEHRIKRVTERQNITVEQARELIEKTDKSRAAYYNYYTNKTWGASASYDLSINIDILGARGTVDFIKEFIDRKHGSRPPHFG